MVRVALDVVEIHASVPFDEVFSASFHLIENPEVFQGLALKEVTQWTVDSEQVTLLRPRYPYIA